MAYRLPKIIKKSFVNYGVESANELKELKKLKVMAVSGRTTEQKIFISIDKPTVIEVREYDLSNYSRTIYSDFNKKLKSLIK